MSGSATLKSDTGAAMNIENGVRRSCSDIEIAMARRVGDQTIVQSGQRRRDVRFEGSALFEFTRHVLSESVRDERGQFRLVLENRLEDAEQRLAGLPDISRR